MVAHILFWKNGWQKTHHSWGVIVLLSIGGIHSLRKLESAVDPFVKKVEKGDQWLQSPGKQEHVWGLVYPTTQCDTSWEVQVLLFFFGGDGRVRVFWSIFHGFFRKGFQFSSFALVETCFTALESCLSNAHPDSTFSIAHRGLFRWHEIDF